MECRTTFTKSQTQPGSGTRPRRRAAFTLVEAVVAMGILALLVLTVMGFMLFSGRSFAALFNYVDLNDVNRIAIDQITRDVRQANRVTSYQTNRLELEDSDGSPIVYAYSPDTLLLTRSHNGSVTTVLKDCDQLSFSLGQRNTVGGSYDIYPAATPDTCKVINVTWVCSRTIFGRKENSESVQTARIVIRKQGS